MHRQQPSYALLIETGAHAGMVLPLTSDLFTIGRELDNTLVLDSPRLSRYHAHLRVSPAGTVLLEDLGSTNGTFIEGYLVAGARRLMPGDAFTLAGTIRLRLIEDESKQDFVPPTHWTVPTVEPVRFPLAGSDAPATESETWIAPALAPTMTPTHTDTPEAKSRAVYGSRPLVVIIGLLLVALCGSLALGVYLWRAPDSFWQQVFAVLNLPFPSP